LLKFRSPRVDISQGSSTSVISRQANAEPADTEVTAAAEAAAAIDRSPAAIIVRWLDGQLMSWSDGAEHLLGYTHDEAAAVPLTAAWPGGDRFTFEEVAARLARGQPVPSLAGMCLRKGGAVVEVSAVVSPVRDDAGAVIGVCAILRDRSDRTEAEKRLAEEQNRWEGAFDNAPIGMALVDLDGGWLAVNRALCRLLGRDEAELLKTDFQSLTHPDDLGRDLEELARVVAGETERYEMEKRYLKPDESVVWALLSVSLVRDYEKRPLYFVSQLQDITARKDSEAELQRYSARLTELARQDPLTGLSNYREFHAMLDSELERGRRYRQQWSLVLFDVDGFEAINARDRFEGDRVLHEVGTAITSACRASDLAARIGGDEFALILPSTSEEEAIMAALRIAAEVARAGIASLSFGAASWPRDGDSKELLLLRADMQLRSAQAGSREAAASRHLASIAAGDRTTDAIHEILSVARQHLGMELAYLSEIGGSTQTFIATSGDAASFGIGEGSTLDIDVSYCKRMLAGEVPNLVPVVAQAPALAVLPVTTDAGIGSYIGVPVRLSNGHVYGSLCAVSHDRREAVDQVHVRILDSLARLIASHIEHDAQHAADRRSDAELAGMDALLSALSARDHYTGAHSQTVVGLATDVARSLGLSDEQVRDVGQVARLHDIGKVGIPDSILQKRGPLNDTEWELMRQHPAIGARILSSTRTLAHLAPAVKAEHERFDGHGYPDGLVADAIPLASRITFACDAYHAMTSDRPYRTALDHETALGELRAGAGSQFDPQVVDALLNTVGASKTTDGAEEDPPPSTPRDVLIAHTPRQTPLWEPHPVRGSPAAIGDARARCRRCGAHVRAVVTRAAIGGNCTNCGSYDLDLTDVSMGR
jgi:diguanylate cyclase (GGDEF)-like protein/PAS domain S-box-containing protein